MKVLYIGDIVGKPGRLAVRDGLPKLVERHGGFDLVVANAENAAAGHGLTLKIVNELTRFGIHFMTTGNHVWDQKEFVQEIEKCDNVIRPANLPPETPGRGLAIFEAKNGVSVGVLNLGGSIFMNYDNPFQPVGEYVARLATEAKVILVDLHAEATSEKIAMGRFLDGRVSLVVGTHTHVQTADEQILPNGTAYITDLGMTGPHDGIIGVDLKSSMPRFTTKMPAKFDVASGWVKLNGVVVEIDAESGQASSIERVSLPLE
ncbi:MAG: TIGR00282 family metallophosphoesterase [Candidatus Poribacteria bacterium]|nr:TIGR00282 family metallophosphoesterase [Candidatus Poribacteria bacterium]